MIYRNVINIALMSLFLCGKKNAPYFTVWSGFFISTIFKLFLILCNFLEVITFN